MMQHFCIHYFISVVMFQVLKTITNHGATRKKRPWWLPCENVHLQQRNMFTAISRDQFGSLQLIYHFLINVTRVYLTHLNLIT